jgi:predicted RNA-binding protein YlxR (DUF448 family)
MNKLKNIKIRTCIICFNKLPQEKLIRIFVYNNSTISIIYQNSLYFTENNNLLKLENNKPKFKEIMKNKSRSIYFCKECLKNKDINRIQKKIKNYLLKLKNPLLTRHLNEITINILIKEFRKIVTNELIINE